MRILVVDDSSFMQKLIKDILNSDPELNVVGTASDGVDAIEKAARLHPDVITLDINMPRMDGLTALKHLMEQNPTPVIMLSSLTREGANDTLKALDYGAVDYVLKPSGPVSLDAHKVKEELINKIKAAGHARIVKNRSTVPLLGKTHSFKKKIILIGASTGGPPAVENILIGLPKDIPPILLVQHMPPVFTRSFANRLGNICKFKVKEAEEGDLIVGNSALVAPGGYHMTVGTDERVHLNSDPPLHGVRPAVDPMMESAARNYGAEALGILLTGMGRDGALGMKAVKQHGGLTIAQNEESCVIFGMPKAAIEEGCVDEVLPLSRISREIISVCQT